MPDFGHPDAFLDKHDPEVIRAAKRIVHEPIEYRYKEKDIILYNLGVGATAAEEELKWTYENDEAFEALPTFGVIPQFYANSISLDFLPNFSPVCAILACC
jgi:hypothetical protein